MTATAFTWPPTRPTRNKETLEVLALNSKDGKLIWSTKIGSYTTESNPWMVERTFQPALLLSNGFLSVDTHAGSLVQVDTASGQVQWGLNYVSEVSHGQPVLGSGAGDQESEQFTTGVPQIVNGTLYLKGMRSQKLYAVDPQRPKVSWHRPVSRIAYLIGVDESKFYLGGDDVSAFDVKTRRIIWSVKVHMGTTWAHALLTEGRIYHFSARGIFEIVKVDGKVVRVFRGADLDSLGGNLVVTPKLLLTVSNLAVTAYPLNSEQNDAKSNATSVAIDPVASQSVTTCRWSSDRRDIAFPRAGNSNSFAHKSDFSNQGNFPMSLLCVDTSRHNDLRLRTDVTMTRLCGRDWPFENVPSRLGDAGSIVVVAVCSDRLHSAVTSFGHRGFPVESGITVEGAGECSRSVPDIVEINLKISAKAANSLMTAVGQASRCQEQRALETFNALEARRIWISKKKNLGLKAAVMNAARK